MPETIVQLKDISKRYHADEPDVLQHVDLAINAGDAIAVVGPSGCGKSTLLNIIGALDPPSSGTVEVDGQQLYEQNESQRAEVRNRRFGFVFQDHHLLPQCTAVENVLIPTLAGHVSRSETNRRAHKLLERVGLRERMDHKPGELSGGQRQRVAIVRALINKPALLLIDEPTGALDEDTAQNIMDLLIELNEHNGVALLMVTHAPKLAQQMKTTLRLDHGRLTDNGK